MKDVYNHLAFSVKVQDIIGFIEEKYGVQLRNTDIHNHRRNWKKDVTGGLTDEELLSALLKDILEEDPHATCEVITDEDSGEAQIIFLQTSKMRRLLDMYPTVLFVDSTYKTNDRSMPLFSVMVVDGDRRGQVAAHALILNEQMETLKTVLHTFRIRNNIDSEVNNLRTVIIDKDFSEIGAIKEVFPNVNIIICKFHVKQAIDRHVKSFGKNIKDITMTAIEKMCISSTEEQYNRYVLELEESCPAVMPYFRKQWHSCREHWAGYAILKYDTLGHITNNIIESNHNRIKLHVGKHTSVPALLKQLVVLSVQEETKRKNLKAKLLLSKKLFHVKDVAIQQELEAIYACATPQVAKQLAKELRRSQDTIFHHLEDHEVTDAHGAKYHVDINSCSCIPHQVKRILCRHIFFYRSDTNSPLFQTSDVNRINQLTDYFKVDENEYTEGDYIDSQGANHGAVITEQTVPVRKDLNQKEKIRKAEKLMNQISDQMSNKSMFDFDRYFQAFKKMLKYIKLNEPICVFTTEEMIMNHPSTSSPPHSSTSSPPHSSTSSPPHSSTSSPLHPSTSSRQQESTSSDQQPSTFSHQQPSTSSDQQPSTSSHQQPSTSSHQQPSTSSRQQPSTSSRQQPSTSSRQQPSTSRNQQPSTSSHQQPSAPGPTQLEFADPLNTAFSIPQPKFVLPCKIKSSVGGSKSSQKGRKPQGRPLGSSQKVIQAKKKKIASEEDFIIKQRMFLETILFEKELVRNVLQYDFYIEENMLIDIDFYRGGLDIDAFYSCIDFFTPQCFRMVQEKMKNRTSIV